MLARRSRTAVAPLERLKILMQVQGNERIYRGVWQVTDPAWTEGACKNAYHTSRWSYIVMI